MVMSRWGAKLHRVNCPCGVCISKRRKQHVSQLKAVELDEDVSCTTALTPQQTLAVDEEPAPADDISDLPVLAQSPRSEGQQGKRDVLAASAVNAEFSAPALSIAPAASADAHGKREDKPMPKVLLYY